MMINQLKIKAMFKIRFIQKMNHQNYLNNISHKSLNYLKIKKYPQECLKCKNMVLILMNI